MPMHVMTEAEIDRFLEDERVLRLGLAVDDERYMLALGYLWRDGAFYCVTGKGRKTEMARRDPRVSFQVDDSWREGPFGWTSVVGQGSLEQVDDTALIGSISPALFARFDDMPAWAAAEYEQRGQAGDMVYLRLRPEVRHGRRSGP